MLILSHYMYPLIKIVSIYLITICLEKLKGAVLVNAARGAVINTPDLIEAVNNGTLSGAAIDTYENEAIISHLIGQIKRLMTQYY